VDRDVQLCGGVWGDGAALNMKWHWLTVGGSNMNNKFKNNFLLFR